MKKASRPETRRHRVEIPTGDGSIVGALTVPNFADGLVVFAGGVAEGAYGALQRQIAGRFEQAGLGTMYLDLLSRREHRDGRLGQRVAENRPVLSDRLVRATHWAQACLRGCADLAVGYFACGRLGGAALQAAREFPGGVRAVALFAGRRDRMLQAPKAPQTATLLLGPQMRKPGDARTGRCPPSLEDACEVETVPGPEDLETLEAWRRHVAQRLLGWYPRHFWRPNPAGDGRQAS